MHRRLIPALVLIALGSLFLLDNLGLDIDAGRLLATWWPALLNAAGVADVNSSFVLRTVKQTGALPLGHLG